MQYYNFLENISVCRDIVDDASQLLFYSHIPVALLSLIIGIYILLNNKKDPASRNLFFISLLFAVWSFLDLVLWLKFDQSGILMFAWSAINVIFVLIYITSFLFVRNFLTEDKTEKFSTYITFISIAPLLLLLPTDINLVAHHAADCVALENIIYADYYLLLCFIYIISIFVIFIKKWKYLKEEKRKPAVLMVVGIQSFLLTFFVSVWGIGYLMENGYISYSNYNLEQYGLFGMPIFMSFLAYVTIRFKSFNIKLAGAQALVIGLVILIGSLQFVEKSFIPRVISAITFIFTIVLGFFLIQSVKKEVKQREELEQLTDRLEAANERLKELDKAKSEFVSIASHQLRSPLTAIRGYASMLAEGSFGQMPQKAQESAKRIEESAKLMAMSIEDYLNVSRIESGNMKYNLSDFNIVEMASHLCDDLRPEAMNRNLILLFRSNVAGKGIVNADVGKTNQIIHNLVNNSIKYTPKGSVSIFVRDDIKAKRIYIDITDTGIGMSQETISKLFGKFSRANNANSVNTSGTGLGLYVALKMAEAMGGTITCTSEGDGKGSTFTFELPLAM